MLGSRQTRKPTFLWQGLLIILPVAVMSVVGLLAIRRDRAVVEEEARRSAEQLVSQITAALANGLPSQLAAHDWFSDTWYQHYWELARGRLALSQGEAYSTELNEWQAANPGLDPQEVLPNRLGFGHEGEMVWPPDYAEPPRTPDWVLGLTEQQRQAWDALARVQFSGWPSTNFQTRLEEFLQTKPSLQARANARFLSLRANRGQETTLHTMEALEAFADECRGFRSESGLSLLSLVDAEALRAIRQSQQARFIFSMDPNDRGGYVGDLVSWALDEPSLLTPRLLAELESLIPDNARPGSPSEKAVRSAMTIWTAQQRLHQVAETVRQRGLLPSAVATNFWIKSPIGPSFCQTSRGELDMLERQADGSPVHKTNAVVWLRIYSSAVINSAASRVIRGAGLSFPEYVGLRIQLENGELVLTQRRPITFEATPLPASWSRPTKPGLSLHQGAHDLSSTPDMGGVQAPVRVLAETRGRFGEFPMSRKTTAGGSYIIPRLVEPAQRAEFKVQAGLVDPELLFAQQGQRTLLVGGLILASTMAASVGLLAAYRAFSRQLRLSELKSNFVSSVSHELRAPIASVRLMAESLERGKIEDSNKQQEYFRFIVQECRRLSSLIENVLDFSRIEQGRKQFEFEPIDIVTLTSQTVKLMQAYAAERQVALTLIIDDAVGSSQPQLTADGKAIQQALINLIDNAVKHSPQGQTVIIGLEVRDGHRHEKCTSDTGPNQLGAFAQARLALWVKDHGEGIPPEEQVKIFERFYRLGSELRRETQGVGIGLSIVKHVVEAHGGRVLVDSAVGKGSRFTIELPLGANKP